MIAILDYRALFCLLATWNQFDGVTYVYGDKNVFSRVLDYFSKDKTVEYRTKALLCFLPKWKGFLVNEAAEEMDASEALLRLQNVVTSLTNVWVEESGYRRERNPTNFDVRKVIQCVGNIVLIYVLKKVNESWSQVFLHFSYSIIALMEPLDAISLLQTHKVK